MDALATIPFLGLHQGFASKASYQMFHLSHLFSKPVHDHIFSSYEAAAKGFQGETWRQKTHAISKLFFKTCAGLAAIPCSLSLSALGALFLKMSGRNYLFDSFNLVPFSSKDAVKVLTYNVGFLPGELAEKLTVGDFGMSYLERQEIIVDFLTEQFREHDLLLLEEAVDFGFVERLTAQLKDQGFSACIYSRISANPLSWGLPSGLCIISKTPLRDFQVGNLLESRFMTNKAFAAFKLPNDVQVIHSHLSAGSDDERRFRQLGRIAQTLEPLSSGILIGDYNFTDWARDQIEERISALGPVCHYVNEDTMTDPTEKEHHPDIVTGFGNLPAKVQAFILEQFKLSDHLPISITIERSAPLATT